MSVSIRMNGTRSGTVALGDLKRKEYFIFANSNKDVPNLYQMHEGQYSRKKTGKIFDVDPSASAKGSSASDKVYRVNVEMTYTLA